MPGSTDSNAFIIRPRPKWHFIYLLISNSNPLLFITMVENTVVIIVPVHQTEEKCE